MNVTRWNILKAGAIALVLGLAELGAGPALAHANLTSAVPAVGGRAVPSPAELKLAFSEPIELAFTTVKVTGPDGQAIATRTPTLDPADGKTLIVSLTTALPTGTIKVEWTAVASDGHKSNGAYTFEIQN